MGNTVGKNRNGQRITPMALLRRYYRDRNGVAAIEFAMLAFPFFLLLFAILESCIAFAAQQLIANTTADIARQVRTGQLKLEDVEDGKIQSLICDRISLLVSAGCPGLEVDLRQYSSFEAAAKEKIKWTPNGDLDTTDFDVNPGGPLSPNMLRVFYRWPVVTDIMRKRVSNLPDGKTLLFASNTWRNEPFN
ncbi:TadE/TadG family type IV pilus assembly protein [Nitratireductor basaltis]|uniref:TadE family protein n=1 Tax=Nitratireductor basaltis TaxID=472175 RepID=A0A084UEE5_9HYPH|nr:TadE/TadG family type IV pilus assembly protein [Nitratireductor basaltis]KFB11331.1 TadE family protein [Nitratireductor basaltis]